MVKEPFTHLILWLYGCKLATFFVNLISLVLGNSSDTRKVVREWRSVLQHVPHFESGRISRLCNQSNDHSNDLMISYEMFATFNIRN